MSEPFAVVTMKLFDDGNNETDIQWAAMSTRTHMITLGNALKSVEEVRLSMLAAMPVSNVINYSPKDLDTMFRTVWAEARGEGPDGETAVAWVIRNRAERAGYAHELLGAFGAIDRVCKAPWQFSCWNANDPNLPELLALQIGNSGGSHDICQSVLNERVADPTNGADMYYAPQGMPGGVAPYWASTCKQVATIGHQIFFDSRLKP